MEDPYCISHPAKLGRHYGNGFIIILFFLRDLARPHDYMIICLHGLKPLKVSHQNAKFCGQRHCDSGDLQIEISIPISVFKLIPQK